MEVTTAPLTEEQADYLRKHLDEMETVAAKPGGHPAVRDFVERLRNCVRLQDEWESSGKQRPVAPPMTFEKRTVIEQGLMDNGLECICTDSGLGASINSLLDLLPPEAREGIDDVSGNGNQIGPTGRFEIIVRWTPEEK